MPLPPINAQDLATHMREAQINEFGDPEKWVTNTRVLNIPASQSSPVCPYPTEYFRNDVFVIELNGGRTERHPKYCATDIGCEHMVSVLAVAGVPVTAYKEWSQTPNQGNDRETDKVWFVKTADGKIANVGLQLERFTYNYSLDPADPYNPLNAAIALLA